MPSTAVLSLPPVGEGESAPLIVGGEFVPPLLLLLSAPPAAAAVPPNSPTLRLFCAEAVVATEEGGCYSSERQPGVMRTFEFTEGEGDFARGEPHFSPCLPKKCRRMPLAFGAESSRFAQDRRRISCLSVEKKSGAVRDRRYGEMWVAFLRTGDGNKVPAAV